MIPLIIYVDRKWFTDTSTVGEMVINGERNCFTLEDKVREPDEKKVDAKTAIPSGQYEVIVNFSNRFQRPMPLLLNVPNFEGVRIHSGNTSEDTEGCILLGKHFDVSKPDLITESRAAFSEFFSRLESALKIGKVLIHISNGRRNEA